MDAPTQQRLHDLVRRESLSELMYVGQAFPWTSGRNGPAMAELARIIAVERDAIADLGRWLQRRRMPVGFVGGFPSRFTSINFLAFDHILGRLIHVEKGLIDALEGDLTATQDLEARSIIEKLLFLKREHLAKLEQLATPDPFAAHG